MDNTISTRNTATLRRMADELFDRLAGSEHAALAAELVATVRTVAEAFEVQSRTMRTVLDVCGDAVA